MNKRKTLIYTIGLISAFIALITVGAKIFTGYIGNTDETDNNLSIDRQQLENSRQPARNYSYFKMLDMDNPRAKENYICYEFVKLNAETIWYRNLEQVYEPLEGMISFQQAANIGGETFKYLYGITYHSHYPAFVLCYKFNDGIKYLYYLATEEQEERQPYFKGSYMFLSIDGYTGEILGIDRSLHPVTFARNPDINYPAGTKLTDEAARRLKKQLANDLEIIGRGTDIEYGEIEIAGNSGYFNYYIDYSLPDNIKRYAVYNTVDHKYFEMKSILNKLTNQ